MGTSGCHSSASGLTDHYNTGHYSTTTKMKNTLFILAALLGMAMADEDGKALVEKEEGRLFGAGIITIIASLVNLGVTLVILLALINFVHSLKGAIDFDSLFAKGEDDYGYPTGGYGAPAAPTGGSGSSYSSYRRQGVARAFSDSPVMQRLSA